MTLMTSQGMRWLACLSRLSIFPVTRATDGWRNWFKTSIYNYAHDTEVFFANLTSEIAGLSEQLANNFCSKWFGQTGVGGYWFKRSIICLYQYPVYRIFLEIMSSNVVVEYSITWSTSLQYFTDVFSSFFLIWHCPTSRLVLTLTFFRSVSQYCSSSVCPAGDFGAVCKSSARTL